MIKNKGADMISAPFRPDLLARSVSEYSVALEPVCYEIFLKHFINAGGTHATADTHGNDTAFGLAPSHFVQQLRRQFGPGCAERMTERDCSAVGIDITGSQSVFDADRSD